jgi:hypothetical protein
MSAAAFADSVVYCRKCVRRLGAQGKAIRKALKRDLKAREPRPNLKEAGCYSLCPRRGQVLATYRKGGERRLVVVESPVAVPPAVDYLLRSPIAAGAEGPPAAAPEPPPEPTVSLVPTGAAP